MSAGKRVARSLTKYKAEGETRKDEDEQEKKGWRAGEGGGFYSRLHGLLQNHTAYFLRVVVEQSEVSVEIE